MKVWVALDVEEASVVGVAATAELAKTMAEADNGSSLTWRERSDDWFTAGPIDYSVYRVQPFEVIE